MKSFAFRFELILLVLAIAVPVMAQRVPTATRTSTVPTVAMNGQQQLAPASIAQNGVSGNMLFYNNTIPDDASIVFTAVRQDWMTGLNFVDPSTAKRFGRCKNDTAIGCIRKDGTYFIPDSLLPAGDHDVNGRMLDIRGEASGYYHYIGNIVRVWATAEWRSQADQIPMNEMGVKMQGPYVFFVDDRVIAVGIWIRNDWGTEDVNIDFSFSGSSLTRSTVDYGVLTTQESTDPNWHWVVRTFYAPPNNGAAYYGGGLCGEIQIRSVWSNEWIADKKKACAPLVTPKG